MNSYPAERSNRQALRGIPASLHPRPSAIVCKRDAPKGPPDGALLYGIGADGPWALNLSLNSPHRGMGASALAVAGALFTLPLEGRGRLVAAEPPMAESERRVEWISNGATSRS